MQILKYTLQSVTMQTVEMRAGSRILSVGEQNDRIVVWVAAPVEYRALDLGAPVLDTTLSLERRRIAILNTGEAMKELSETMDLAESAFVGTVQMRSWMVHHVFDLGLE